MIDSFINYDSNPAALSSPSYFGKNTDDAFKYNFADLEPFSFINDQCFPNLVDEAPKTSYFDQFSNNGSAYSTNPSIKHSPEHTPNLEDLGAEDDSYMPAELPRASQKGIKKHYEPIIDNNKVYRYEDSPSEYRKARKRIQNRESATRVRNRKKTQVEELDEQIEELNKEKTELKVQNAALITENNLLKQQISFLERVVSRNGPEDMIDNTDFLPDASRTEMSRTEMSDSILNLMNKSDEDEEAQSLGCKYFRAAPSHKFKRHVALLGVFTLLLCVYGLVPRSENNSVQLFARTRVLFSRPIANAIGMKTDMDATQFGNQGRLGNQTDPNNGSIVWIIELITLLGYLTYFIYVAVGSYKRCFLNSRKSNVYSSLP
jgi:regulator of replication initiation timing